MTNREKDVVGTGPTGGVATGKQKGAELLGAALSCPLCIVWDTPVSNAHLGEENNKLGKLQEEQTVTREVKWKAEKKAWSEFVYRWWLISYVWFPGEKMEAPVLPDSVLRVQMEDERTCHGWGQGPKYEVQMKISC